MKQVFNPIQNGGQNFLRRPGVAILFTDIIKIVTIFFRTNFKDSNNIKIIEN